LRTIYTVPILRNARHEKFAQELAKGESAHQAYINAGFRPSRQNAGRLRTRDDVAGRLRELQAASAAAHEITITGVLKELDAAISLAKERGMPRLRSTATAMSSPILTIFLRLPGH
jgi:hypothetical protein